jgi:hypothetical protein
VQEQELLEHEEQEEHDREAAAEKILPSLREAHHA